MRTKGAPVMKEGERPRSCRPAVGVAGKKVAVATPGEAAWRVVPLPLLPCGVGRWRAPPVGGSGPMVRSVPHPEGAAPHAHCRLRDSRGGATTGAMVAAREMGSPGTGLSRATGRHEHARPSAASLGPCASCPTSSSCVASQQAGRVPGGPPCRRAAAWPPCAWHRRAVRGWGCVGRVTGLRTRRSRHHPGDPHGDRATRTGRHSATALRLGADLCQNHGHRPCLVHVMSTWPDQRLGRCPWSYHRPSGETRLPGLPRQLPGGRGGAAPHSEPEATRAAKCPPGRPTARPLQTNSSSTSLRCRRRPSWNWTNRRKTSRPTRSTTRCCHWPHPAVPSVPSVPTCHHHHHLRAGGRKKPGGPS